MYKIATPLLALILVTIVIFSIYPRRQKDYLLYQELLASSNPTNQEKGFACCQQRAEAVSRHIWYQEKTPLHVQIKSQNSELSLCKTRDQIEVVEELENVTCIMQEELYFVDDQPMQKIYYLEAIRAKYNYHSQLFNAEDAQVWHYQVEGHILPTQKPSLNSMVYPNKQPKTNSSGCLDIYATARNVEFALKREPFNCVAHQVKATFSGGGGILECETLLIDHTKMRALLIGKPQVIYSDAMGKVYADRAQVDYKKIEGVFKATKVTLFDHVKLVHLGSQEKAALQYALADELCYNPEERVMMLEGKKSRVLFYDALHHLQLSAQSVRAQRDPHTGKESVQGIGDVRCLFGPEELEKIKGRFQLK